MFAMSDDVFKVLITTVGSIFAGFFTVIALWLNHRVEAAKRFAEDDARKKDVALAEIGRDAKEGSTWSNHTLGVQKQLLAFAYRSEANRTGNDVDIAKAEAAEKAWADHQEGQARVDARMLIDKAEKDALSLVQKQKEVRDA